MYSLRDEKPVRLLVGREPRGLGRAQHLPRGDAVARGAQHEVRVLGARLTRREHALKHRAPALPLAEVAAQQVAQQLRAGDLKDGRGDTA